MEKEKDNLVMFPNKFKQFSIEEEQKETKEEEESPISTIIYQCLYDTMGASLSESIDPSEAKTALETLKQISNIITLRLYMEAGKNAKELGTPVIMFDTPKGQFGYY